MVGPDFYVFLAIKFFLYWGVVGIGRSLETKFSESPRMPAWMAALLRFGLGISVGLGIAIALGPLGAAGYVVGLGLVRFGMWLAALKLATPGLAWIRLLPLCAGASALNFGIDYVMLEGGILPME